MRVAKQRQLLQRGWAVGDVDEFLGLTPEERALIDLRLRLANGLKLRRAQRRLTQGELAGRLKLNIPASGGDETQLELPRRL